LNTFLPSKTEIVLAGKVVNYFPYYPVIHKMEIHAGATIGSAIISFPTHYASDCTPEMGKSAKVSIGGKTVFRGIIGDVPFSIGDRDDSVQLLLYDDKWLLQSRIVGQIGIGTQPTTPAGDVGKYGFTAVGFELIFNKDGKPNKDPSKRDFSHGSTAVHWTLKDIMLFLFDYYVPATVATIAAAKLSTNYNRKPSHLALVGKTALQAIDDVAKNAGESWGLVPGSSASSFTFVRPGYGTEKNVTMVKPKNGARADSANQYWPRACQGGKSMKVSKDVYQVVSGNILKETTYTNTGSNPLLKRDTNFKLKGYSARFSVDVTKYKDNNLGENLTATSQPKKWKNHLLTRVTADGSTYLSKADLDGNEALLANEQLNKPLCWISLDGTAANARLVTGGMTLNVDKALLVFKPDIQLMQDPDPGDSSVSTEPEKITIDDWTSIGIWLTIVTQLEMPDYVQSADGSKYLPSNFYQVVRKPDLVPERRQDVWLPDPSDTDNNGIVKKAEGTEEKYVDVASKLQDVLDAAVDQAPAVECPLELEFPFFPIFDIGDNIVCAGREIGATGDEVVIFIGYDCHESYVTRVKATNVVARIDWDEYVKAGAE